MPYNCPTCHKSLKNKHGLADHMKRIHADKVGTPKIAYLSKVKPKSEAKEFKVKVDKEEKSTYKCGACGASLDSEVSPCPKCGVELKWS